MALNAIDDSGDIIILVIGVEVDGFSSGTSDARVMLRYVKA